MQNRLFAWQKSAHLLLLTVSLAAAATGARAQDVSALGRLEPQHGILRIGVSSTSHAISGSVIRELLVGEGDWVEPGQLLAVTDSAAMLRSRLTLAKQELTQARLAAEAAESHAAAACTRARVAAGEAARRTRLLEQELASTEEAEQSEGEAEASAASCTAARATARVALASVDVAAARVEVHAAELERSLVRAPSGGQVLDIHTHPGELAGAEGVLELGRTDRMVAIAEVYETDIGRVRRGQSATISSDALAHPLTGRVERIRAKVEKQDVIGTDPAARKDARIIEVVILLDEPEPAAALTNLQVDVVIEAGS